MTNERKDGGPAFPKNWEAVPFGDGQIPGQGGMSLRDYFAAKALQGFASDPQCNGDISDIAKSAYRWADAMLAEREKVRP